MAMVNYSKAKGTGKSLVSNGLMDWVIGRNMSMLNSSFTKLIKDTFTDYWEDCILATLEEMPSYSGDKDSKTGWDFCKSLTTEDNMSSRGFMTAPDKMDIWVNLVINTNHFHSIDPGFCQRRAVVNIINAVHKGDYNYFKRVVPAFNSYEGWENYIHRYLIKDYHQFSSVKIEPMESLIPITKYRTMLMARGNDSIIYFFKMMMENMEDKSKPDNPYHRFLNRKPPMKWSIGKLFEAYNAYKIDNGVSENTHKTKDDFEKALMVKFEIDIKTINNITERKPKLQYSGPVKSTPTITRDGVVGKCIEIDESLINAILDVVKQKNINTTEHLDLTDQDVEDDFEDPSQFITLKNDGGGLDFLPEDDDF